MKEFGFNYSGVKLYFGKGSVNKLKEQLKPYSYFLIATSKTGARVSGALDDVKAALDQINSKYIIYDGITPNPTTDQAQEIAQMSWENGAEAFIAIGGGSVIDAAKMASVIHKNGGKARDYLHFNRRASKGKPLFAINLTHGTGTEIDRYAVLTDEKGQKRGISLIYPAASADDPSYMTTLPKNQTVYTSLDAFYHSYESMTRLTATPMVEMLALEAIGKISEWLPKCLNDLKEIEARYWLLYSSMLAGVAIDMEGTHIIHMLEHALSGKNPKVPHGAGLAMLGARAVYYTHKLNPVKSAEALRAITPGIKPVADDADRAQKIVEDFQKEVGFSERLSDYGFTDRELLKMVDELTPEGVVPRREFMPMDREMLIDIMLKSL